MFLPNRHSNSSFSLYFAILLLVLCTGCTSVSLKMEPHEPILAKRTIPVKFKFSTISWNTANGLPFWFSKPKISNFIDNIKARAPELFAEDDKALPMTFYFDHSKQSTSNGAYNFFLSFLSGFTIFPAILKEENSFDIKIKIGEKEEYVETHSFKIYQRKFFSFIPFYAFFMPAQDNSFCHKLVSITDEAVETEELQNVFLNMIYRLDRDKLRKIFDEKHGEEIQLLGTEE